MAKSAQQVAAEWRKGLTNSASKIRDGVMAVTSSPMMKAAQQADAMLAGVQRAVESGKWQEGLASVSLEEWKTATAEKGVQRLVSGATAAEGKVVEFMSQLLPYTERVSAQIAAMPSATQEDRRQKMLTNFDLMTQFKFRKRQGR